MDLVLFVANCEAYVYKWSEAHFKRYFCDLMAEKIADLLDDTLAQSGVIAVNGYGAESVRPYGMGIESVFLDWRNLIGLGKESAVGAIAQILAVCLFFLHLSAEVIGVEY